MGLKTLHLTNAYHDRSGGIRTMYHALMAQAACERREMRLIVPADTDGEERVNDHAVIHRVRAPRAPAFDRRYRVILPPRFLPTGRGPIWRILQREQPDVVEICDKYSLCYLAGLVRLRRPTRHAGPTLVGLSCERLDDNIAAHLPHVPGGRRLARAFLGRVYIGMFDAHLANSDYTAAELREAMTRPHTRPVDVVSMGVDLPADLTEGERQRVRRDVRERLRLERNTPLVTYAGRLSPEKHLDPLVAVAARLRARGARLAVAGDGPDRESLEMRCARVAPGVAIFLGHADRAPLSALIAASDVFVHPNPREPFGIGPLEAMAAGVSVVLPRSGGVLSYASDDNAWLVSAGDESVAQGVEAALGNPARSAAKVVAGQGTARRFAWPAAASRMFAQYDAIHRSRRDGLRVPDRFGQFSRSISSL